MFDCFPSETPHLNQDLIIKAHRILQEKDKFVIGTARDGGFCLFGGNVILPKEVWTSVTYGQPQTCDDLVKQIGSDGKVVLFPTLSDADVASDLPFLMQELQNTNHQATKEIENWIETTLAKETQWA